jgi:hypothetical protein
MITTRQTRPCDVCRLVDFDCTPKSCGYCGLCDAWICDECNGNWPKRLKAAIKRKLEPGYQGQSDYIETQQGALDARARTDNNIPVATV